MIVYREVLQPMNQVGESAPPIRHIVGFDWYVPNDRIEELLKRVEILFGSHENGAFVAPERPELRPSLVCGPEGLILTYKGKLNASLFFKIEGESLIVTQIIGEKGMKVGHMFDYRTALLRAAQAHAIERGCIALIVLSPANMPYGFLAFGDNNVKNSTISATTMGCQPDASGNYLLNLSSAQTDCDAALDRREATRAGVWSILKKVG